LPENLNSGTFTIKENPMDLEDLPRPKPKLTVGDALDTISIAELHNRITELESEIARHRAEITRKLASKQAADAFFKS
jgi:uncharacterized small protein (DUF1192 family)